MLFARFEHRLAMRAKILFVPHQASVNFSVVGNVGRAKVEGVVVTCVLGEGSGGPQ
jgi:hypothetical protein